MARRGFPVPVQLLPPPPPPPPLRLQVRPRAARPLPPPKNGFLARRARSRCPPGVRLPRGPRRVRVACWRGRGRPSGSPGKCEQPSPDSQYIPQLSFNKPTSWLHVVTCSPLREFFPELACRTVQADLNKNPRWDSRGGLRDFNEWPGDFPFVFFLKTSIKVRDPQRIGT